MANNHHNIRDLVTSDGYFDLLVDTLGHPINAPSFTELIAMNPHLNENDINRYLHTFCEFDIITIIDIPPERQKTFLPAKYFVLTDEGMNRLREEGIVSNLNAWKRSYSKVSKPLRLEVYERLVPRYYSDLLSNQTESNEGKDIVHVY